MFTVLITEDSFMVIVDYDSHNSYISYTGFKVKPWSKSVQRTSIIAPSTELRRISTNHLALSTQVQILDNSTLDPYLCIAHPLATNKNTLDW